MDFPFFGGSPWSIWLEFFGFRDVASRPTSNFGAILEMIHSRAEVISGRTTWTVLGICVLLSTCLHVFFLASPGFEDDLRWQIHLGKRVAKEGLWKLYEGDYSARR